MSNSLQSVKDKQVTLIEGQTGSPIGGQTGCPYICIYSYTIIGPLDDKEDLNDKEVPVIEAQTGCFQ